ncbi:hypothetical protein RB195_012404 [Necator americanus]|uniref:Secreted protein n=1 Tax=Necator americanus TaxID=51031 RepID=A0ABR1D7S1_NECAM
MPSYGAHLLIFMCCVLSEFSYYIEALEPFYSHHHSKPARPAGRPSVQSHMQPPAADGGMEGEREWRGEDLFLNDEDNEDARRKEEKKDECHAHVLLLLAPEAFVHPRPGPPRIYLFR